MAYLNTLREFHAWRERLPLDCLLCRCRTPGGLCQHCRAAVCASMAAEEHRCRRCALSLAFRKPASQLVLSEESERLASTGNDKALDRDSVTEALRCARRRLGLSATVECKTVKETDCPDCRGLSMSLVSVVAAFDYAWPGDLLIQRLKLRGRFSCAPLLAGLVAQRAQGLREQGMPLWCEHRTLVTAVPSGNASLRLRGYNPATETGRALARRLGLQWRPGLVLRAREGGRQKHLGREARRRSVQGLYRCPGGVSGRDVLVVDDVMTTGSTLSAIAQALTEQGAANVWGAVLARTPARNG